MIIINTTFFNITNYADETMFILTLLKLLITKVKVFYINSLYYLNNGYYGLEG